MTKEQLEKAITLHEDIKVMDKILDAKKERNWIRIITPKYAEHYHSIRFQRELAEWVKTKKQEYEEELERL